MLRWTSILFVLLALSCVAQKKQSAIDSVNYDSIRNIEFQLEGLSHNIINSRDIQERRTSSYYFVQTLKKALKVPQSFNYEFNSLKTVAIRKPANNAFRIFTWNLLLDSGKYEYFGAIQMNNSDSLVLFGLYDSSSINRDIYYSTYDHRHWMGALVYQIHHYKYKRKDYYITFGWNGMDATRNRKIIDVLTFDEEGLPTFGEEIFDFEDDLQARVIFDFADRAVMLCRYDEQEEKIVFANVVPINPMMKGNFGSYIPDGTYDFLEFKKGIWRRKTMLFEDRDKNAGELRRF